jgi:hypothetical protein
MTGPRSPEVDGRGITLKDAGAGAVTVLCLARWLDRDYGEHGALIDSLTGVYDALRCPVTGGACPPPRR